MMNGIALNVQEGKGGKKRGKGGGGVGVQSNNNNNGGKGGKGSLTLQEFHKMEAQKTFNKGADYSKMNLFK